jgi:hypothetical protein
MSNGAGNRTSEILFLKQQCEVCWCGCVRQASLDTINSVASVGRYICGLDLMQSVINKDCRSAWFVCLREPLRPSLVQKRLVITKI